MRVETSGKDSHLRLSDGLDPAFGLDVESVNAEGVLFDYAVYASVSGASEAVGSSIADGLDEIEDGLLEVVGLEVDEGVEDVGGFARSEWRGVRSEVGAFDRLPPRRIFNGANDLFTITPTLSSVSSTGQALRERRPLSGVVR